MKSYSRHTIATVKFTVYIGAIMELHLYDNVGNHIVIRTSVIDPDYVAIELPFDYVKQVSTTILVPFRILMPFLEGLRDGEKISF